MEEEHKGYIAYLKDYLMIVWPIMINLLSFVFISLADKLMIARLGNEELVGASSVNLIVFIPILFSVGCCTVLPSMVASGNVRKNYKEGTQMLYALLLLCGIISVIFTFLFVGYPHLLLAKVSPSILEKVKGFFWAVCSSAIFGIMIQPLRKYMEGLGWFRLNMVFSVISGVANIILNYIFIYGLGPIPTMGVVGAGIATLIVRILTFFVYLYFVFGIIRKRGEILGFCCFWEKANPRQLWNMLKFCFPGGIELFIRALLYRLADRMLYKLYPNQVDVHAAGTILFDIIRYTSLLSLASAITSTILMGRAFGTRDQKAQMRIGIIGYGVNATLAIIGAVLGFLLYPHMFWIMQPSSSIITKQVVGTLIGYAGAIQIADSLNNLGICLLRGKKDVFIPVALNVVSLLLIGLPASFLLGITYGMEIHGILWGLLIGFSASAVALFVRFAKGVRLFKLASLIRVEE